jgi:hypothetical protein
MSRTLRAGIFGLVVAMTTSGVARESISIRVSPTVAFAPAELVIQTSIEPDANNRAVEIIADSAAFYRSSEIQLEGDRAPKTTTVWFHGVPPGEYDVTAAVIGADGQPRAQAHAHVNVLGAE